jgi:integrase-like protein
MIALLCFFLALFVSPFKSTSRLEAENAALRHQLIVLQRRVRGRVYLIRDKPIAPGSPWENGFAERLIGSIRRECVDHVIVLGEAHLRRILQAYARYYNDLRTPDGSYVGATLADSTH